MVRVIVSTALSATLATGCVSGGDPPSGDVRPSDSDAGAASSGVVECRSDDHCALGGDMSEVYCDESAGGDAGGAGRCVECESDRHCEDRERIPDGRDDCSPSGECVAGG